MGEEEEIKRFLPLLFLFFPLQSQEKEKKPLHGPSPRGMCPFFHSAKKGFAEVLDRAAFFKVHPLKDATEAKLIV